MTPLSSATANRGFTPLPIQTTPLTSAVAGRGLSIQQPRKHQREIPVGQGFEHLGIGQDFGRVGVGRRVHGASLFFLAVGEMATDGKPQ